MIGAPAGDPALARDSTPGTDGHRRPMIALREVGKTFHLGDTAVHALRDVTLAVREGDLLAIMGPSGSGKSTLMNIIGCLDLPDHGRYVLEGVDVRRLTESEQASIRNRRIGFVFQGFNLIARTPALENVELPLVYAGVARRERRRLATEALESVGLGDRLDHQPSELSGGQQQRVAIARAIVTDPALLLADEPTGALDSVSSASVLELFSELNAQGRTVVLITHEEEVSRYAKRVVRLHDGRVVSDERRTGAYDVPPGLAARTAHTEALPA
jgi:putative ABC transport system ATP-binding protein